MTNHDTKVDGIFERISQLIPDDMNAISDDIRQNIKSAMIATLKNMDLVTREEFEVQSAVLARTRELLEQLEEKVQELEEKTK